MPHVVLHLVVIIAAAWILARELSRELAFHRAAWCLALSAPPGDVARAARPRSSRRAPRLEATVAERFPGHVAVALSTGFRVYRLPPGSPWQTREEVEVYGTLAGWSDAYCGTSLPRGMTVADVASLPRAERAPAPPPIAVCIVAWCALPTAARDSVRLHTHATKAPGVMRLGAVSLNTRGYVERILLEHGLTILERTAEQTVWGTR